MNHKKGKKEPAGSCECCVNYIYDEEYEYYTCDVNLDEDDMYSFLTGDCNHCP